MRLFASTYTLLHRRRAPSGLSVTPEGRALLLHLAWTGPLTIGDLALHTCRAQSVVSESVAVLESRGLLARVRDPRDRRRTLVWLTELARAWLAEEQEPLDGERLAEVLSVMGATRSSRLLEAFEDLVRTTEELRMQRRSVEPEDPDPLRHETNREDRRRK